MLRISNRRVSGIPAILAGFAVLMLSGDPAFPMASIRHGGDMETGTDRTGNIVENATNKADRPESEAVAPAHADNPADGNTVANTARDGNIAIKEEFVVASEANSIDALKLFIARHPGHPLAKLAERKLQELLNRKNQ